MTRLQRRPSSQISFEMFAKMVSFLNEVKIFTYEMLRINLFKNIEKY